jgi:N-acetylglucosamine kinase-like BadF-type ATPase
MFSSPPLILAYNDSIGALASGTYGILHGIVCISGTGMICYGCTDTILQIDSTNMIPTDGEGSEWVCGGNGCLIDYGSGYSIGLDTLRAGM